MSNIKLMNKEKLEQLKWLMADFYCDYMDEMNITDVRAFNRISKIIRERIRR